MILNSVLDFNYIYKMGPVLLQRYNNSIVWPLLKLHLLICGILVYEQTSKFKFTCLWNETLHTKRSIIQNALMLPTCVYIFVSYLFTFLEFARMRIISNAQVAVIMQQLRKHTQVPFTNWTIYILWRASKVLLSYSNKLHEDF